ncbi:MAG: CHASE4 domain-containing protein [Methanomicrobiales archaeon]
MKIHTRTLIIIGTTILILILAMIFLAQFFILASYAQIEQKGSVINVERVTSQIKFEEEKLGDSTRDWAMWDDTYTFITDRNSDYISSNLDYPSAYESLQVNGILFYDSSGNNSYSRWYNLQDKTEGDVPQGIQDYFSSRPNFLKNLSDKGISGFIQQPEGLYMVSLHTILTSHGEGPARGTLIMVRSYDDSRITALQDRAHIPLKLIPLDEQWLNKDPIVLQLTAPGAPDTASRVHDSSTLQSNKIVYDIENKPVALLKVTTQRDIYQQANATVTFFIVAFMMIAIIFGAVTELLLRRYIVTPLADLDFAMKVIGKKRDLSERLPVSGDDEIASLKNSLNTMLQELQDSQTQLAQQREQLAEANRKANIYLDIYLDVLTYEIMNAIFSLRGYAEILKNSVGEKEKGYTLHMIETLGKGQSVIRNIETISKIYKNPPEQKSTWLNAVVTEEIRDNEGITIRCRNCEVRVLADEMLQVVFQNLISNSIKSGGEAVIIEVEVEDLLDGMLRVSVSDTGTGIPDGIKPGIFDRFMLGSEKRSSYGLGLHIAKMLIEAYGGRIWADDRVQGHPEQGAAIRFTLKKG